MRDSFDVNIGNTVRHPPGNTGNTCVILETRLLTAPYVENQLQGCTIVQHEIVQGRTNRFAQIVSRKQYCKKISNEFIVLRNLRQRIPSDNGRIRFSVGEFNLLVLMDRRLIYSLAAIGERKLL